MRYARRAALDVGARFVELPAGAPAAPAFAGQVAPGDLDVLHLHYTDQLYGDRCEDGPAVAGRLVEHADAPTVVTFHDVPDAGGDARDLRRARAYRAVAASADLVIVASDDERSRLRAAGVDAPVEVVPMSWEPLPTVPVGRRPRPVPIVGVLGYLFPGKGHREVVEAAARLDRPVEVWAIGRVSDGHEDLRDEVVAVAARLGVPLRITGFVPDERLAAVLAEVDVPVAAHRHRSASASLLTWIGARRRPITRAEPLARELAGRAPGALALYDPADPAALTMAIRAALDDPGSTVSAHRPDALSPTVIAERVERCYVDVAAVRR